MFSTSAIRWGIIIGLVNLAWLCGSFYMGMHTVSLRSLQTVTVVAAVVNVAGYVAALGMETRRRGPMPYGTGFKLGMGITFVNAAMAGLAKVLYLKAVNPGWPEFMAEKLRLFYEGTGRPAAQVETLVASAAAAFSLPSQLLQALVSTLILGAVLSAVLMVILRQKQRRAPAAD